MDFCVILNLLEILLYTCNLIVVHIDFPFTLCTILTMCLVKSGVISMENLNIIRELIGVIILCNL